MIAKVQEFTVPCSDGEIPCSIVRPARGPAAAVLVISTVFGVDHELQDVMREYTELGFITVAPDLFWRILPGPLDHRQAADYERGTARFDAFDVAAGIRDLRCVVEALNGLEDYAGTYGIIGFCFGGRYAFLAAALLGAAVAVSFHGSNLEGSLEVASRITCPISLHYGDADSLAPTEAIERIRASLRHNKDAEIHIYPGVGHGYTSPTKPSYDESAMIASHGRAKQLLRRHLLMETAD